MAVILVEVNPSDEYYMKNYNDKERFISYFYQINSIQNIVPKGSNVLEIGIGSGFVSDALSRLGYSVTRFDIEKNLKPDVVGNVSELSKYFIKPFFDVVLCAEVLEHMPFEKLDRNLEELRKVSKKYVVISVPHNSFAFTISFKVPHFRSFGFMFKIPKFWRSPKKRGEHYWEGGYSDVSKKKLRRIISRHFDIMQEFNPHDDPYHLFYVCEKKNI